MRHAPLAAALALLGCSKLTSDKVVAAVLLEGPAVAGQQIPGGPVVPDVPPVVTAQLYFGDRPRNASDTPDWLSGAEVVLRWEGPAVGSVALTRFSGGAYSAPDAAAIPYVPGATYIFDVIHQGKRYAADVVAPARPQIAEFSSPDAVVQTRSYAGFSAQPVTRPCPGGCQDLAFYTVGQFVTNQGRGEVGQVTCDNYPRDGRALLDLMVNPDRWKVPGYTLTKAECFPPAVQNGVAALVLTALQKGKTSSNLFISSAVVAGSAAAGGIFFTP